MVHLENFNFIKNYYCKMQQRYGFFKNYISLKMILFILFSIKLISISYINDDILITIRTVLNFINGHGPVFNLGERVQAYTHPLWFFILSGVIYITQEIFYTLIFTNAFFSVLAIYIIIKAYDFHKLSFKLFFLFLFSLSLSVCFVDYTSSGLENGLGFFLFSLLLYCTNKNKWTFIPIISGLLFLTRMDYTLMYLPFLIYYTFCKKDLFKNKLFSLSCFFALTGGWLFFSLVYYGSLFPNTYFAKTLIDSHWSFPLINAENYYKVFIDKDLFSFLCIISFLTYGFYKTFRFKIIPAYTKIKSKFFSNITPMPTKNIDTNQILIPISVLLYLLYIVWVGGDFMMGRFFSIPFFITFPILFALFTKQYQKIKNIPIKANAFFGVAVYVLYLTPLILIFFEWDKAVSRPVSAAARFYSNFSDSSRKKRVVYADLMTTSEIMDEKFFYFFNRSLIHAQAVKQEINSSINRYKQSSIQFVHFVQSNWQDNKDKSIERRWFNFICKTKSSLCYTIDVGDIKSIKKIVKLTTNGYAGFDIFGNLSIVHGSPHFMIDTFALTVPLLSRIQLKSVSISDNLVRPGHFERHIPKGYIESIKTESNQICNTKVKKLYNDVRLLTRSKDLWNWNRLKLALKMSFQRKPLLYKECER